MINNINSYQNNIHIAVDNNTKNKDIISKNNTSLVVQDTSKAINRILGYDVDSEGYFTSGFNEVAGIPKEFKIYARGAENLMEDFKNNLSIFVDIDIVKSLGRAYKVFSQLTPQISGNFTQKDLENFPQYFQYNDKSLELTKIYTKEEYINISYTEESLFNNLLDCLSFPSLSIGLDFVDKNNDIFESSRHINLGENAYKNADGSISKGGVLMAFLANGVSFLRGETTVSGKLAGFDENFGAKERRELINFMKENPILYGQNENEIGKNLIKELTLGDTFTDVEGFKQEWLKMKAQSDEAMKNHQNNMASFSGTNTRNKEENSKKSFKSIQTESKSQTYKDKNSNKNLDLAKMELMKEILDILFNQKSSSNSNYKELHYFISSKTSIGLNILVNPNFLREFIASKTKKVDIKA
ncbi:hypothetical protein OQH60_08375 [Campylobacter sp. MIT 21-1685]|uniref:Cj0814 family flagellar-dependent secreted protein n=1 Tax=unclassified Campylobacter TaxID=2593542 RepID=UPI00224AA4D1|nr:MULTISPECIES: hypothetical protein [unclassified Campylobacter]MCX2683871.1 hypothetical protein [Campylobacter sp. MIT 21-1684]MCX2752155.1 hypothetical protein [Campylobacter sp. MIT 21-1682]MCX2808348.1 hypothetical protein [Campylobacter sp. MIT 21-1685]